MTTLEEKVRNILDESDFNELPLEERRRIRKYRDEQQILTIGRYDRQSENSRTCYVGFF